MRNARMLLLVVIMLLGAGQARAQRTAEPSMLILAGNRGIFVCTVNVALFNVGTVNADGSP